MKIGFIVEGQSEVRFFTKLFEPLCHSHPGILLKILHTGGKEKLKRRAEHLVDRFIKSGFSAVFILIDSDTDVCPIKIRDACKDWIPAAFARNTAQKSVHLCVVVKELESWYLADAEAINRFLPNCGFQGLPDTSSVAKRALEELVKKSKGPNASYNPTDFAQKFDFSPERAIKQNPSFKYFWTRLTDKLRSLQNLLTGPVSLR